MFDVLHSHRIHVMNQKTETNFMARDSQVTSVVTKYDRVPYLLPLQRSVEVLIQPASVPKGRIAHLAIEAQILETLIERL